MKKRTRGRYFFLLLFLIVWCFAGCSDVEILTEVPGTMQVEQENAAMIRTEDSIENTESSENGDEDGASVESGQAENGEEQETLSFLMADITRFAYDSLSAEEQIWYQEIEQALGTMSEETKLSEECLESGLDESCIDKIFQCVLNDHPEIFYVDGYTYTKYCRGVRTVAIDFAGNYQLTKEEAVERKAEIDQAVQAIVDNVDMQASDYNKVKYVFETLIRRTEYDLNAPDNQNIYSVFVGGSSVCQGYAKATQYLLNCLGVECTLVQGTVENGQGHAWNLVRVDGSYYYVDTTWGDASYQQEDGQSVDGQYLPEINYDYLCVTTEQLLRTHTISSIVPMPECMDTAANYYVQEGALFESYDKEQMARLFKQAADRGENDVTVKCANEECFRLIKSALIDEQDIFDYLPDGYKTVSYAHSEKQLSLTFWVTN